MHKNSQSKPAVSLLIAAYNEENNIAPLTEKILRTFSDNKISGEIIFINDGSTDKTQEALEKCSKDNDFIKIFNHRKNLGLTGVLKTGLKNFSGEIVFLLPADLESDPEEDIPKLLKKMKEGYDVVVGWRQGRKDGKVATSKVYNFISRILFKIPAHDMNWIKAIRRKVIDNVRLRSDWYRYLLPLIASNGYKIGEVKTNWYPRNSGKTKFGLSRIIISSFDLLTVKFVITFTKKPMLFFGSLGVILIGIGVITGLFLIYLYIAHATQIRPIFWSALVLILSGLIFLMMGFLSELIVEGHQRIEEIEERFRDLSRNKQPKK